MRVISDDFFRLAGGFRHGENHEQLRERISEIVALETHLKASKLDSDHAQRIRDRLRQLKSVDATFAS